MTREIVDAVKALEQEKGIDSETLMSALEDALLSAYKKTPGAAKYARVDLDRSTADFRVFELILPPELEEKLKAQVAEEQEPTIDPETGELREPEEPELDPEILAPYEDQISSRDVTPGDFGRIAAQTAKQVILQRIREAERQMMFDEYQDRVGELITGIIQQSDNRYTLVQLRERVEALLPRSEQVWNERYDHGMRIKAVITDVSAEGKGPSIVVSRRSPELIKQLFELEVPEIADGLVEIVGVAREPGYRSKIAVMSHADGVDPVGACVGPRGSRVRMVVSELRGEKIDIIPYNEEPARFVAKALSPARVREVLVDDETKQSTVIVPDDQLSLAIGREGQNARLAAKLTGWKVDIKSETEFSQEEELEYDEGDEAVDGRCAAVLSAGRRCPNASLPGSRYCGLPQHQALARFDTNQVTVLGALSDEEVAMLADPDADADDIGRWSGAPRRRFRRRPTRRRSLRRPRSRRQRRQSPRGPPRIPTAARKSRSQRRSPRRRSAGRPRRRRPRRPPRVAKKRVHEIAKERGLTSKEVLEALRAAGIEVKAAASSVEEEVAAKALEGGGDGATATGPAAAKEKQPEAKAPKQAENAKSGDSDRVRPVRPVRVEGGDAPPRRASPARSAAAGGDRLAGVAPGAHGATAPAAPAAPPWWPPPPPVPRGAARQGPRRREGAGGHQDRFRRDGARGGGDPRPRKRRGDQEAHGARRDGDAHADAARRDDPGARRGPRPEGRDP